MGDVPVCVSLVFLARNPTNQPTNAHTTDKHHVSQDLERGGQEAKGEGRRRGRRGRTGENVLGQNQPIDVFPEFLRR